MMRHLKKRTQIKRSIPVVPGESLAASSSSSSPTEPLSKKPKTDDTSNNDNNSNDTPPPPPPPLNALSTDTTKASASSSSNTELMQVLQQSKDARSQKKDVEKETKLQDSPQIASVAIVAPFSNQPTATLDTTLPLEEPAFDTSSEDQEDDDDDPPASFSPQVHSNPELFPNPKAKSAIKKTAKAAAAADDKSDGSKQLLSLPEFHGEVQNRYYLTGLHYYFYSSSDDKNARHLVCRHCGTMRRFPNKEGFVKNIAHSTLHLQRHCTALPASDKAAVDHASKVKGPIRLSLPQFAFRMWKRTLPVLPAAANTRKPRGSSGPRKPKVKSKPTAGGRTTGRPKKPRAPSPDITGSRPKRASRASKEVALSGLRRLGRQDSSSDVDDNHPEASMDDVPDHAKIPSSLPVPEYVEPPDPWHFCEDGHTSLFEVYQTVTKYTMETMKNELTARGKPTRATRIRRIVNEIDAYLERGYNMGSLIVALERIRGGRSLYSFTDFIHTDFQAAARLITKKVTGPLLRTEADDQSTSYVEERAFLFHDPPTPADCEAHNYHEEAVGKNDLVPLPPAAPLPYGLQENNTKEGNIPTTSCLSSSGTKLKLSFHPGQRTIYLDFSNVEYDDLTVEDLEFLGTLMERDDVTVISKGLVDTKRLDTDFWNLKTIQTTVGKRKHHKFKRFSQDEENPANFSERDNMLEGTISDFVDYAMAHQAHTDKAEKASTENGVVPPQEEEVSNENGNIPSLKENAVALPKDKNAAAPPTKNGAVPPKELSQENTVAPPAENGDVPPVDNDNVALVENGPRFYAHKTNGSAIEVPVDPKKDVVYMIDFDLPRILPRHSDDFFQNFKVKEILPGGKWCMMNSLPKSARPFMGPNLYVTPGGAYTQMHQDGNGTVDSGHCCLTGYNEVIMLRRIPERHKVEASQSLPNRGSYDALYKFPHENGNKPGWPKKETIAKWKEMGYYPSVFILKAGEHVHINKGRLHAFRKLTTEPLPVDDCHYELRNQVLQTLKDQDLKKAPLCISIAWDWQFTGIHAEGINREVTAVLECQLLLDQKKNLKCLAIPRACLLAIGQQCLPVKDQVPPELSMISSESSAQHKKEVLTRKTLLKGIRPALSFVLEKNISFTENTMNNKHRIEGKLRIATCNDTAMNPLASTVDPDGNDYFCRLCSRELENVYLHCDGCENLLQKDFNICMVCHTNGHWKETIDMHGSGLHDRFLTSSLNHTGSFRSGSANSCGGGENACVHGRPCNFCTKCTACSCDCHRSFTVRRRFYDLDELKVLRDWLQSGEIESLKYGDLTDPRLHTAADRKQKGYEAKRRLLLSYPRNSKAQEEAAARAEAYKAEKEAAKLESAKLAAEEEANATEVQAPESISSAQLQNGQSHPESDPMEEDSEHESEEKDHPEEDQFDAASALATLRNALPTRDSPSNSETEEPPPPPPPAPQTILF